MSLEKIKEKLLKMMDEQFILEDVPMARYTSFKAGGNADMMVIPQYIEELKDVLEILAESQIPYMVIGNGSNILVKDSGYKGIIVKMGDAFDYVIPNGENLICGAASLMSVVSKTAIDQSLTGFEFGSGIPGSIGGAVFMNAGAYDGEMSNIIDKVRLISKDGERDFYMTAEELQMGYRHTLLHETSDIVVEVTLKLHNGNQDAIKEKVSELAKKRNSKQPVNYPSAGSFFKRPQGYFAGKLVQDAGLKGLSVGGAQVSQLHSGFIINTGGATATDILQLMEIVQAKVMEQFGVELEPEVRIIG